MLLTLKNSLIMKIKLIVLSLLFMIFSSCNKNCKEELKKTKETLNLLSDTLSDIRSFQKIVLPVPDDIDNQSSTDITSVPSEMEKNLFPVSGNIDIDNDEIYLKIYVPESKLKIVNYANISTNNVNAILVVLDGNGGISVGGAEPKKIISKKIKILKNGFNVDLLKKHNALAVIVLHDDNFNSTHVVGYQRQIIKYPNYKDFDKFLINNWKINSFIPDEDGGDIIP